MSKNQSLRDLAQDTGNQEADRLIGRLMSSDPDFDDCADAARLIRALASAPVADERAASLQHFCLAFEAFSTCAAENDGETYAELERAYEKSIALLSKLRAPVADEREMSLAVALHFADFPRPYHTLEAPADTNGELYRALAVLAREYRAARASAPVAGVARKGWRLVPEKLTEEMRAAGEVVTSPSGTVQYGIGRHALALAWEALLSAAPMPPATKAAPQASEAVGVEEAFAGIDRLVAVRDAALEEVAQLIDNSTFWVGPDDVRALKSQSAALSAQPGAQKDRLPQRVMAQVVIQWLRDNPGRVPDEAELVEAFELKWQ